MFKLSKYCHQVIKTRPMSLLVILVVMVLASIILVVDPASYSMALDSICISSRSFVGISELILLGLLIVFGCAMYDKKIGGTKSKKDFKTISWLAMIFACGMGIGLVFYGLSEPILHAYDNPYMTEDFSPAYGYALAMFNWGIHPWVLYGALGFLLARAHFDKGRPMRISSVFPNSTPKFFKKLIDLIVVLGVLAGLTTSLGLGVVQLSEGMMYTLGWTFNPYVLILGIGLIATFSVASGLNKGIKYLSNITIALAAIMMLVTFVVAYHLHDVDYGTYLKEGVSLYISKFFTFSNSSIPGTTPWAAAWSVFYQLWFASWAAFVGIFLAKVSKGRTYGEFTIAVLLVPTIFTGLWFWVFGGAGIGLEGMHEAVLDNIPTSIFVFYETLDPYGHLIASVLVLIIIVLFFVTSSDSGSYVVSSIVTKKRFPIARTTRIFWSLFQILVASFLMYRGGLVLVQSASVVMGVLIIGILLLGWGSFILETIINLIKRK